MYFQTGLQGYFFAVCGTFVLIFTTVIFLISFELWLKSEILMSLFALEYCFYLLVALENFEKRPIISLPLLSFGILLTIAPFFFHPNGNPFLELPKSKLLGDPNLSLVLFNVVVYSIQFPLLLILFRMAVIAVFVSSILFVTSLRFSTAIRKAKTGWIVIGFMAALYNIFFFYVTPSIHFLLYLMFALFVYWVLLREPERILLKKAEAMWLYKDVKQTADQMENLNRYIESVQSTLTKEQLMAYLKEIDKRLNKSSEKFFEEKN